MEVSALTGESVEKLFLTVGELMNFEEVLVNFWLFLFTFDHHSYSVKKICYYLCCKPL